jgi:hypothetical protein
MLKSIDASNSFGLRAGVLRPIGRIARSGLTASLHILTDESLDLRPARLVLFFFD